MRILITGAGGQIAKALRKLSPKAVEIIALGHSDLDIGDSRAVENAVEGASPYAVINAAAYTAVDNAESEPELALRVNGDGPGYLATAARRNGARFLHISTDFVFDGQQSSPYAPDAVTCPLSAYGASKLLGERRVQENSRGEALILRTAWVYAAGGRNFVRTMLKIMRERNSVRVIQDQVGSPTWADSVARVLWATVQNPEARGIHHWTDAGVASWYDFAVAIAEEAQRLGILEHDVTVQPISTADYPTPARRPAYSVLDRRSIEKLLGLRPAHWRTNLREMLMELKHA